MILTEAQEKWKNLITEEMGVQDNIKSSWMAKYAQTHELFEGLQGTGNVDGGIYSTPLNTIGIGNPMMPAGTGFTKGGGLGNTGADFHATNYSVGSGDIPMSTLTMGLEIAAMTIGLELVPVVPATGPWAMLTYMDFPYAGGKLGRLNETSMNGKGEGATNKPIYIKVSGILAEFAKIKAGVADGALLTFTTSAENATDAEFTGKYLGTSRIDGNVIVEVVSCVKGADNISIADFFGFGGDYSVAGEGYTKEVIGGTTSGSFVRPELVTGAADHITKFSNFAEDSKDPMTRAQNETGVGNTIGARMFSKIVQMGSYEVTGSVTRQQLQDMPLYGIDVVGKVLEQMQNEISQAINNRILDRLFKLGVTNAKNQKDIQGVDLNLYLGGTAAEGKVLKDFKPAKKFIGIDEVNYADTWGTIPNANHTTAYENVTTNQRRISSRILAAANIIANVSRRGRGQWMVTNTAILTAMQDASNYVVAPMTNSLSQDGSKSLYFAGSVAGINLYVDPYMQWEDTRICVGRKASEAEPGVVFMPYILADKVQTLVEGTMAPKLLVNSRFAIVDAGFYPEQSYFTFMVDASNEAII